MRNMFKKISFSLAILIFTLFSVNIIGTKVDAQDSKVNKIPIAMATDNNYIYPTIIAMTSMLENKKESTYLDFHIMISGQVSEENRNKISNLKDIYDGCSVELIDMKDKFNSTYIISDYITKATYYRLLLPSLLSNYDKVLYLDGDIIVRKDLWDMYSTDLGDNYIGAVKDLGEMAWDLGYAPHYAQRLGVKDMNQVINAGVLIMNLKKMREDNLEKAFNEYIPTLESRKLLLNDQDVLNATCYDRIKFINPEYNAMQHFRFNYDMTCILLNCYNAEEWNKSCSDPTIIHYTSRRKPWKGCKCRFYDEWEKYRKIAENKVYGAPIIANGVYAISSALGSDKVLNIAGASNKNSANLQLCTTKNSKIQKFKLIYIGGGYYEIEACCSGKVLEVANSKKSHVTNVVQNSKHKNDEQKWLIKNAGNGYYYIVSKCNGLYLDVSGSKTKNGTNIRVWNPNGSKAQKFKIFKV